MKHPFIIAYLMAFALTACEQKDHSAPEPGNKLVDGADIKMAVVTDPKTGCQYLVPLDGTGNAAGISLRYETPCTGGSGKDSK